MTEETDTDKPEPNSTQKLKSGAAKKTLPGGQSYECPSDRMFRRSRRAEMRRRQAAADDARFFRAVYSLAGVATVFVFILIYLAQSGGGQGLIGMVHLAEPWLGPFSKLEIFGFGFIAVLAGMYLWRIRKKD